MHSERENIATKTIETLTFAMMAILTLITSSFSKVKRGLHFSVLSKVAESEYWNKDSI